MSSEYQIETRRRSRSKTPFLRSEPANDDEKHQNNNQRKKTQKPSVQTIVEEAIEVTSSSSPHTPASAKKSTNEAKDQLKSKTSDYSSEEPSPENKARKSLVSELSAITTTAQAGTTHIESGTATYTSTTTTIARKVTRTQGTEGLSGRATSTPKGSNFNMQNSFAAQYTDRVSSETARSQKEARQNELNAQQEHSEKIRNNSSQHNNSSSFNHSYKSSSNNSRSFNNSSSRRFIDTSNIDPKDHLPYMEYKSAGEYWNTTPKTDYTYSELSPHRRELAPGVVAMPNMSRRSLGNYGARIDAMIERNQDQEEWIRRRYQATNYNQYRRERYDSSGDEVDQNRLYTQYQSSWLRTLYYRILTIFTSIWMWITGGAKSTSTTSYEESYYRKYYGRTVAQPRGFFGTIGAIFQRFYSFVSRTVEWILYTIGLRSERGRYYWLLFLAFLPLLLLPIGLFYYLNPQESFPPKSLSQLTMKIPAFDEFELPKIDLYQYVNEEKYAAFKTELGNRWDDVSAWSHDYWLYLKTISQNLVEDGRRMITSSD